MSHPARLIAVPALLAGAILAGEVAMAQAPPSISSTQPGAVSAGGTTKLKVRGGNLVGAADFWASFGGELKLAGDVPDNGKNAAEGT